MSGALLPLQVIYKGKHEWCTFTIASYLQGKDGVVHFYHCKLSTRESMSGALLLLQVIYKGKHEWCTFTIASYLQGKA